MMEDSANLMSIVLELNSLFLKNFLMQFLFLPILQY